MGEVVDEVGHEELGQILDALREPDLGQRALDEVAQPRQAAMEDDPGAPRDADVARLEDLERQDRRVDEIPQLVRQKPEALAAARGLLVEGGLIPSAPILGDGARNRVVQASVQRAEVIDADRRAELQRQIGDGLTDVAVVVDDLRHGEALKQQVVPMQHARCRRSPGSNMAGAQRVDQLIQEQRDAVIDLSLGRRGNRPGRHLRSAAADDLFPVLGDEFVKHGFALRHPRCRDHVLRLGQPAYAA